MYKKLKFIKAEIKNNKGFGLVQVLVAAGLMGVVSLGIVTMLSNASKSQRGLQAKDRQREVMAELTSHLSDQTACLNSFGGSNPTTPFIKTVIKDALNNAKYTIDTNEGSNLLQYKKFKIQDWVPDAGYTNRGTANLAVTLTKQGDIIGVRDIQQKIGLKVNLDASNNISNCYSVGGGGGAAGGRTSCPAGFTLSGTSGSAEAFCISTNEEAVATWLNAVTNCSNKNPAARLCTASEWVQTCVKAAIYGVNNMTDNWEWLADVSDSGGGRVAIVGDGSCDEFFTRAVNYTTTPSRCCFR